MVSRLPRCLQDGLSEIELSVKMRSSQKKTVRPYAPLRATRFCEKRIAKILDCEHSLDFKLLYVNRSELLNHGDVSSPLLG